MEFVAVIDISSFIWCQKDFARNTNKYYELMQSLPNLYSQISENKSNVLLREELYEQILLNFPYSIIPSDNYDFQVSTLDFLTNLGARMIVYPSINISSISSNPDISKQHYDGTTKLEVRYLLTRIHTDRIPENAFFTLGYLWNHSGNLTTINSTDQIPYETETIQYDNELSLSRFFSRHRKKFDHNPKHNQYNSGGRTSPLSCYNERSGSIDKAQLLLDESEQFNEHFYNFDTVNNVYVVFSNTNNNLFHGYDEENVNNIPSEIRRKFNK